MRPPSDGAKPRVSERRTTAGAGDIAELRRLVRERDIRIRKLRQRATALERRLARVEEATGKAAPDAVGAKASPAPFFIVGQAKSGTSWVMRLLDAHPEVMARGEGRFFGRSYKRPDVKRMESATLQPSSLHRAFLDAEYLRAWIERSVWTRDGDAEAVLDELVAISTRHILRRALEGTGKRLVGDKTPFLSEETILELASLTDDGQVIHVIRDGRDVAVSAMHHLWNHPLDLGGGLDLTPDEAMTRERYRADPKRFLEAGESIFTERRIVALAHSWQTIVSRAIANGRELLGDRYTEVRFERLVSHPIAETQRLLGVVGADARPGTAARCVELARFERFSGGRAVGTEDSTAFTRKGIVGDWKGVFTERDRGLFEEEAGELLAELGYAQ
jgi:Sulfotransferase domain